MGFVEAAGGVVGGEAWEGSRGGTGAGEVARAGAGVGDAGGGSAALAALRNGVSSGSPQARGRETAEGAAECACARGTRLALDGDFVGV